MSRVSRTVNIRYAKTQLSRLVEEVAEGKVIVIAKAGTPRAKLVPLRDDQRRARKPGFLKGKIRIAADFNAPLPPELQKAFETVTKGSGVFSLQRESFSSSGLLRLVEWHVRQRRQGDRDMGRGDSERQRKENVPGVFSTSLVIGWGRSEAIGRVLRQPCKQRPFRVGGMQPASGVSNCLENQAG